MAKTTLAGSEKIMKTAFKIFLWLLAILLAVVSFESPQGFIFTIGLVSYLLKDKIKPIFDRFSPRTAFILSGVFFGLLTEVFAILSNLNIAPEKRALLHPDPIPDLLIGVINYTLFVAVWYLLIRKIDLPKKAVFFVSGIYGIFTEQFTTLAGPVIFLGILANPITGSLMAILVMCVYGIFPTLAYMFTKERFGERSKPKWWSYLLALFCLFLFWAIYGNFIHPVLLAIFPK